MLKDALNRNHPHLKNMGKSKHAYQALRQAIKQEWKAID
jgi:hypothetical protein